MRKLPASLTLPKLLAALLLVGLLSALYPLHDTEDFMYYFCKGWVENRGESPYDVAKFQDCLAHVLGRPNRAVTAELGSAYPPKSWFPFRWLARLPYHAAFWSWSALLALVSFGATWLLGFGGPLDWLLVATAPGLWLCWYYHKLTLPIFFVWLWAMRWLSEGRDELAGAALAVLGVQPQWFAAAAGFLAVRRRWRALGWAMLFASIPMAVSWFGGGLPSWRLWAASVGAHSLAAIGFDNQSLFVALYKPLRAAWPEPTAGLLALRAVFGAGCLIMAGFIATRDTLARAWPRAMLWFLLALPYSHGSDALWTLPIALSLRSRTKWAWLAVQAAFLILSGSDWLMGYWTVLLAGAAWWDARQPSAR